jgi:hypothetical protein
MTKYTTYRIATKWLNNNYILANSIAEEEGFFDECRFNLYDEYDNFIDIFQYYITDASESDVEYLEKNFGLKFSYSNKLDCFVLCVDHYGTSWDYVSCEISEELLKINPELEYTDSCFPPMIKTSREFVAGGKK